MKGLSGVLSRLSALPGKAERAALDAALDAARAGALLARGMAPVKTGALRASISASPREQGAEISSDCPYAAAVELGGRYQAARPFLLPGAAGSDYFARSARAIQEALH